MDRNTFELDSITWNDLSLDDIYARLNSCVSSAGEDYLFYRLKNPYIRDCDEFDSQKSVFLDIKKSNKSSEIKKILEKIGKLKSYSFSDVLADFSDAKEDSNIKHYLIDALVIISFLMIFVFPGPGFVLFFGVIAYSVSDYFKNKNIISGKLYVFNYLIRMIKAFSKGLCFESEEKELNRLILRVKEICSDFKPFIRGTFVISEGAKTTSNPFSIILDYIRMIFHVDIIKYNSMIRFLKDHIDEALELYFIAGELDTAIVFSDITNNKGINTSKLCYPDFSYESPSISLENAYHPLIITPVYNSIDADKNVLITGCNASGKSTFLKTIALVALFAQSFGLTFADKYKASYFRIYSSMALKDDINAGESYFISEIKSLKRIVDANGEDGKILCVIDEVLRGTNTVERIASSTEILKSFNSQNTICFAATHDLELTELLADYYENYHFSEDILENDVRFNYELKKGVATSKNAIRLLSLMGYSEEIVEKATKRANDFTLNGVWQKA